MENNIKTLRIQNFKSIKDVTMTPRRVNLIIGMPNVGKSNILEAMSLLGSNEFEQSDKFMGSFIRYEEPRQLFYDNIVRNIIQVETNNNVVIVGVSHNDLGKYYAVKMDRNTYLSIDNNVISGKNKKNYILEKMRINFDFIIRHNFDEPPAGFLKSKTEIIEFVDYNKNNGDESSWIGKNFITEEGGHAVKSYHYAYAEDIKQEYLHSFLQPPYGDNLIDIIRDNSTFRKEVAKMFDVYGLKLMLRVDERRLEVIKDIDGVICSYPYSSIADTLQRIIFYLAAIESNDDAVILLEEPEAHSYPVYVSMLGKRMVESRNNQFFVATHSPYLITEVLEQMLPDEEQAQELAIFVAYYEDYQTKVKQLSDEEVRAIRADGLDVFYNMERFIPGAQNG